MPSSKQILAVRYAVSGYILRMVCASVGFLLFLRFTGFEGSPVLWMWNMLAVFIAAGAAQLAAGARREAAAISTRNGAHTLEDFIAATPLRTFFFVGVPMNGIQYQDFIKSPDYPNSRLAFLWDFAQGLVQVVGVCTIEWLLLHLAFKLGEAPTLVVTALTAHAVAGAYLARWITNGIRLSAMLSARIPN